MNYFCIENSTTHGDLLRFPTTIKKEIMFLVQLFHIPNVSPTQISLI